MTRHRTLIRLSAALAGVALVWACGGDSSTAPPTPEPARPATLTVSPATADLTALGATVQLTAEVRDQNARVMAGATVTWSSGDTSVATVDASGLVTAVGNGTAMITASAGSASGSAVVVVEPVETRPPPREGPAGTVLSSTVWQRPGVITSDDPTAFDSLVYVGRGSRGFYSPFPDDRGWRDTLDLFLFDAHFSGGAVMEVQAHPAYGHPDSALVFANRVLSTIGRLPHILIDGGREVEVSPAPKSRAAGNGCAKLYHFWGDWNAVRRGEEKEAPYMEEAALHEGSHAVLEDCKSTGCRASPPKYDCPGLAGDQSPEWQAAQAADSMWITPFARDHEDMAETWWAWFVSRCVPDRLHPEYKRQIDAGIPNRLAYFDRLALDMRPWQC